MILFLRRCINLQDYYVNNLVNLFIKRNRLTNNLQFYFHSSTFKNDENSINHDGINLKPRPYNNWTQEEVDKLIDSVKIHGKKWNFISEAFFQSKRHPKALSFKWKTLNQTRISYYNHWTADEDKIFMEGIKKYGVGKWAEISKMLINRNNVQIATRWRLISRTKRGKWQKEEDKDLLDLVKKYGKNWEFISRILNRPKPSIIIRYQNLTNDPWTPEEDRKLRNALKEYNQDWNKILKLFPNRHLSDVKGRFRNCPKTDPNVNLGRWNEKEAQDILKAYKLFGKRWKNIAEFVKTRSPSQCAKYWSKHLKKPDEHAYRIY
ncbi:hypothetical protein C1645_777215 [Glomus cerebriforme]|uniref:Homeodomain-like protein n=1 Tax=Glomus cerebriforme TaxID=658196 RepID=A0A397SMZ7_9GLOM|nr:hypothetical protein C1645_777215 [Glomus cerebriforme]